MPYKDYQQKLEYLRKWNKKHYANNKATEKERIKKRRAEISEWFQAYKSTLNCIVCAENTSVCLDFHHLGDEKKDFNISVIALQGWGKKTIVDEISKCIVLCANCHRKVHKGIIKL